ncbi:ABC transporter permease subunit [Jeotgalibacillus haloalkalitolerans]|uniref:ABC transporter permease subunit n=1 Tax=Jeotgalibacillus haloalkalitolerans TaxID=3104292 RepID=A0ABU5KH67_9BACL|nr:ABC transporter permease subunit [Jeotgalibacillus sp. HH7-29]MDZ5710577.1 ABC transporter permease subunit [Jeotgalibacillus sp. HH7-29]
MSVLFKKEMLEMVRSFKWIWMPLVFIALGIMQPLTSYYLPDILEEFGGLPEGAVFEIPLPGSEQVFAETLGQFSQIGVFVIVLALMGSLAGERSSGTAVMILAKPVSHASYFLAKWLAGTLIAFISYLAGAGAALYYIYLLFDPIAFQQLLLSSFFYLMWLIFTVTLVLFLSTFLKRSAAVAGAALVILILLALASSIFVEPMMWTPGHLLALSNLAIQSETLSGLWKAVITTIILCAVMIAGAIGYLKRREWVQG